MNKENKIDIDLLKKALTGNVSSSIKLLKNVPEAKEMLEDYYKKNESKILSDIDKEQIKKIEYYKKIKENEEKDKKDKIDELEEIRLKLLDEVKYAYREINERGVELEEIQSKYEKINEEN